MHNASARTFIPFSIQIVFRSILINLLFSTSFDMFNSLLVAKNIHEIDLIFSELVETIESIFWSILMSKSIDAME